MRQTIQHHIEDGRCHARTAGGNNAVGRIDANVLQTAGEFLKRQKAALSIKTGKPWKTEAARDVSWPPARLRSSRKPDRMAEVDELYFRVPQVIFHLLQRGETLRLQGNAERGGLCFWNT
jgi:hypothetical protein